MQFETKIINGKPSIFFKEVCTKGSIPLQKINTKDRRLRRDLNRSVDISGETDSVKPSPRSSEKSENQPSMNKSKSNHLVKKENHASNNEINLNLFKAKQSSIPDSMHAHSDENSNFQIPNGLIRKVLQNSSFDNAEANERFSETRSNKEDLNSLQSAFNLKSEIPIHKSTMTLAEKKRLQWQQEREANTMLANKTGSINNVSKLGQNTNQINFEPIVNLTRISNSAENLTTYAENNDFKRPQNQSLMEKKKLKWDQDIKDASVPWIATNNALITEKPSTYEPIQTPNPRSKKYKDSIEEYQHISKTLEAIIAAENKIKQEQITEKQPEQFFRKTHQVEQQNNVPSSRMNDQSKIPAAMRTSLMFGDVMYENDIKKTKEIERKKWLQELESQKNEKLIQSQKKILADNYANSSPPTDRKQFLDGLGTENLNSDRESFARTRLLLDPAEIDALEIKKQKSLQHMREIQAQILEKKKLNEVQNLNNLKAEKEGNQFVISHVQQEKTSKPQQTENTNNKINSNNNTNNNTNYAAIMKKSDSIASILHSDLPDNQNKANKPNANSDTSPDSRTKEIFKTMQLAELAAAEEKHTRLLKRLKKGGHDTSNLEYKFNEYKSKILASTSDAIRNNNNTYQNENFESNFKSNHSNNNNVMLKANGLETNRSNFTSVSTGHDSRPNQNMEQNSYSMNNNNHQHPHNGTITNEKIQQIFKILREDTNGIPAEINEDHLKSLLNNVIQNNAHQNYDTSSRQTQNTQTKQKQTKTRTDNENKASKANSAEKNRPKKEVANSKPNNKNNKPPIWNYKNLEEKKFKKNSEKDPFYNGRRALIEERHQKKLEMKQEISNQKFLEYAQQQHNGHESPNENYNNNYNNNLINDFSNQNNSSNRSTQRNSLSTLTLNNNNGYDTNRKTNNTISEDNKNVKKPTESVLNLLTKNLAANTIYEEDEDRYSSHHDPYLQNKNLFNGGSNNNNRLLTNRSNSSRDDIEYKNGFVPFMRTNEFLDPVHATSPIPPSRETSAIKRDREKARQAYFQNMKPADHGHNLGKDPLINNDLVKKIPTQRQSEILAQLAALKQSLIKKQREVASSIALDNDNDHYDLND